MATSPQYVFRTMLCRPRAESVACDGCLRAPPAYDEAKFRRRALRRGLFAARHNGKGRSLYQVLIVGFRYGLLGHARGAMACGFGMRSNNIANIMQTTEHCLVSGELVTSTLLTYSVLWFHIRRRFVLDQSASGFAGSVQFCNLQTQPKSCRTSF